MRASRGLIVVAALASGLAFGGGAASAADECRGLQYCISVPGPWVVLPAPSAGTTFSTSSWLLKCPRGVVGGLDARLTRPEIDLDFRGLLGSPVNPGITTANSVLFTGTYTGGPRVATAYRPFIGCIPTTGGARTPTAFRPGHPTVARALTARVVPGRLARLTHGCRAGERLVSWTQAVGIYGETAPTAAELRLVRSTGSARDGRILVSASRQGLTRGRRVELQVVAVCTRTRQR